jgi:hypothetical protein
MRNALLEDSVSASDKEEDIGISEFSYDVSTRLPAFQMNLVQIWRPQTLVLRFRILDRIAKALVYMEMVAVDDKVRQE